jgi:hypothetical protein
VASQENLSVSPLRPTAWRAWAATFALAVAIIGGLLAMHTLSADHGVDSPMHSMSQPAHPSDAIVFGGDGVTASNSSPSAMTVLSCILVLLGITALLAAVAPAVNRLLAPPGSHAVVGSTSPGWSFSLPPPSLILLSISRV